MVSCDKYSIFLTFLIFGTVLVIWMNLSNLSGPKLYKTYVISDDQVKFNAYLKKFNKNYSGDEYMKRFGYFKKSLEELSFLNSKNGTGAKHGLTKFSDMSHKEFAELIHNPSYGGECRNRRTNCRSPYYNFFFMTKNVAVFLEDMFYPYLVKNEFDWRDHNMVGPVLNQKMCKGCWAFGIVGVIESMELIQNKQQQYTQRSIQELIDCTIAYNGGCKGGHVTKALDWLCSKNVGIITEDEYPLKLTDGSCKWPSIDKYKGDGRWLRRFWTTCKMDEVDILRKVYYHGPVMAVVNAAPWQYYIGGVIQKHCYRSRDGNSVDHVVQIVGYNKTSNPPYYIVKNSWGTDFGEDGYVKVAIGGNICGISDEITYLEVE